MGFEPTTPTLARLCSTPELHPRSVMRLMTETGKVRKRKDTLKSIFLMRKRSSTRNEKRRPKASFSILERVMGFEPTTPTLARLCSTPELHPRSVGGVITELRNLRKRENTSGRLIFHFFRFHGDPLPFPELFQLPSAQSPLALIPINPDLSENRISPAGWPPFHEQHF